MKATIRKMGNSHGVIIPKPLLNQIGVRSDGAVDMRIENSKLVIDKSRLTKRIGRIDDKAVAGALGMLRWIFTE